MRRTGIGVIVLTWSVVWAAEVRRAKAPQTVRLSGVVQALRSHTIQAPQLQGQRGQLTLSTLLPNGSRVKQGDTLAEFDAIQQYDNQRELKGKVDELRHKIDQKRAENRADAAKRSAARREAEAELAKAEIQLRKGPVLAEIETLKNREIAATARLKVASLAKSHASREKAEAAALRVLELQLERNQVGLERVETNIERMTVKAPLPGMVALQNIWRNGSSGPPQEGDQIYPGQSLLRIFDPSQMVVEAQVNQADGARLKPGSRVRVRLDAYPGAEFEGVLEYSSPVAASGIDSPIRFFPARFRLLQSDPRLLPDLSASIEFLREGT